MNYNYSRLLVSVADHIAHIQINRPDRANALDMEAWNELKAAFEALDEDQQVRVIVISGAGKHFCSGIDLSMLMGMQDQIMDDCEGRKREKLRRFIAKLQQHINAVEKCSKPVIAAIHGGCIGAGLDLAAACDMRYCIDETAFSVREIDLGMVADLGVLQRLPRLISDGMAREMAYTGRDVAGKEAERIGLVNQSFESPEKMIEKVMAIAGMIAGKSPLAVRGTKEMVLYTRDHSVEDGLNYIATWNAALMISEDFSEALQAKMQKRQPVYQN